MEKKYPVLECNKELWNEIKPVLESFGITDFNVVPNWNNNIYLISNYGYINKNEIFIGNDKSSKINHKSSLRYLVNTKEEFLSAIAKLLGKEYPIKEQSSEAKYPCIKCTQQLYDKIKDILTKACELKGYMVSYINNTHCNDAENHYFGYCANNETKTIGIYENAEESGLQAIVVEKSVVPEKKKENDLNINKDMEKINIADKLKHCKKGTKLYSPIFGEIEFDNIKDNAIYVNTIVNDDEKVCIPFESNGQFYSCYPNGECLLFPSKDNRDWNSFQVLEEGHRVMCSDNANTWSLRLYVADNKAICFNPAHDIDTMHWQYIVPIEDFDFTAEDITINKEKSIV